MHAHYGCSRGRNTWVQGIARDIFSLRVCVSLVLVQCKAFSLPRAGFVVDTADNLSCFDFFPSGSSQISAACPIYQIEHWICGKASVDVVTSSS